MKIKGWSKFQHFKDRKPPWIKLYREILDDLDWHKLDGDSAKLLVQLWLLASEGDEGQLPTVEKISFRLRISETSIKSMISKLSHWLEYDDIEVISERYQSDRPETETETEIERPQKDSIEPCLFDIFWEGYPRKEDKKKARVTFNRLSDKNKQLAINDSSVRFVSTEKRFVPIPTTYLNGERWNDEKKSGSTTDFSRNSV